MSKCCCLENVIIEAVCFRVKIVHFVLSLLAYVAYDFFYVVLDHVILYFFLLEFVTLGCLCEM